MGEGSSVSETNLISPIESLVSDNKIDEAIEYIDQKLKIHTSGQNYCKLHIYAAHLYSAKGDLPKSIISANNAIGEARRLADPLFEVKGMIELIYSKWMAGSLKEAYSVILDAEKILKKQPYSKDVEVTLADLYNTKGIIADHLGNLQEALNNFEKSLKIREDLGHTEDIAVSLNNIALVYQNFGKLNLALEYLKKSLNIKKQVGNQLDIANCYSNIAINYRKNGNYSRAIELVEDTLPIYEEYGHGLDFSSALLNLILFNEAAENFEECRKYFDRLESIFENLETPSPLVKLNYQLGQAVFEYTNNNFDEALKGFQEIISGEMLDNTLYIVAIQYSIEVLLELHGSDEDILDNLDIKNLIDILSNISQKEQMYPLHVATILFKARLSMVDNDLEEARTLLYQALRIAEKHTYKDLKDKILKEIDELDDLMEQKIVLEDSNIEYYIDLVKNMDRT